MKQFHKSENYHWNVSEELERRLGADFVGRENCGTKVK